MKWQPIATAPKDEWVLVLLDGWEYAGKFDSNWEWWEIMGPQVLDPYSLKPTHWMERIPCNESDT